LKISTSHFKLFNDPGLSILEIAQAKTSGVMDEARALALNY
jgi:hypothetical protein